MSQATRRRILALSSSGGHWVQLLRLRDAWEDFDVVYATVDPRLANDVHGRAFFTIPDGNIDTKIALLRVALHIKRLVKTTRPAVVVTTGAAPGFFAVIFGKAYGAKTIWIDSIANAQEMSLSGKLAKMFSDVWLSQWPEVAERSGAEFRGNIL